MKPRQKVQVKQKHEIMKIMKITAMKVLNVVKFNFLRRQSSKGKFAGIRKNCEIENVFL